jgi:hypothetical protein
VAEDLLDAAQVGAALDEVGCRGVPDRVRASVADGGCSAGVGVRVTGRAPGGKVGGAEPDVDDAARGPRVEPAAAGPEEQGVLTLLTGTTRSLRPLPKTRTVRRPRSSPSVSSPHSSLTRIADA